MPLVETTGLRYPGDEYETTAEAFLDKDDWSAIDTGFLNAGENSAAMSFMSGAALRFYLPAYLVADLRGELNCVDPSFILMHGFAPEYFRRVDEGTRARYAERGMTPPAVSFDFDAIARRRWALLDAAQIAAVIAYMEWVVERDGASLSEGVQEALSNYWYRRASH